MKKVFTKFIFLLLILISCSPDNNIGSKSQMDFIKMFSGIERRGYVDIPGNESIYIRVNEEINRVEFIKVDSSGKVTTKDISSNFSTYNLIYESKLFRFDNKVILVFEDATNFSSSNLIYISFDYDGNFIMEKVLESDKEIDRIRIYENSFIVFKGLSRNYLDYRHYDFNGSLLKNEIIDLSTEGEIIKDIFFDNNVYYITGSSDFRSGRGYTRQFYKEFDNSGSVISSKYWYFETVRDEIRVLNNRIHRTYKNNSGTNIELYDREGNLLNSKLLNRVFNYNYDSFGNFMYVSLTNSSESKNMNFRVLDSELETEIYSKNFGAYRNNGGTGTTYIFEINESENFYSLHGQTTSPKNGDFDLPENSDSFDDFLVRFYKR